MKRFAWRWLVISSIFAAVAVRAETRPQYGGTLRVTMRAAPASLDPADSTEPDSFGRRNLTFLLFDTLVSVENNGRAEPSLAVSWDVSPDDKRWEFHLRRGAVFQDGTEVTAESVAASLRAANPAWRITAGSGSVIIERDNPDAEMLAELALARNAIAKRNPDGTPTGTGPFYVTDGQRSKKLTLAANESYWRGRPFLDNIEIEMGRGYRDQLTELELGKADVVEVPPELMHRAGLPGRTVVSSPPMELIALVFARNAASPDEKTLRDALALSIERASMRTVLLQGAGQPSASILPAWMSGYAFVFPNEADLPRARRGRGQVTTASSTWTLGYDNGDALTQVLAERIALNAKDAGLTLQPTTSASADIKLVRIALSSTDPWLALGDCAVSAGLPVPSRENGSIDELYAAEKSLLATQRVIPLFHLPVSYAAAPTVRGWSIHGDGTWRLDNAWLGPARP